MSAFISDWVYAVVDYLNSLSNIFLAFSFSEDIEEQVCPVLLQLTAGESNDDYRSEAVAVSLILVHCGLILLWV